MTSISICICTRNRKVGIIRLLESIEQMRISPGMDVRVIIVENDHSNFSEKSIRDFANGSKLKISYFLETRAGLVNARNRSVKEAGDCDFCCFTDDDETVSSDWLVELVKCQEEFDATGVAGPTIPVFSPDVPDYIKDFHMPVIYPYGTMISTAYTGCLLLRKKNLDLIEGPFDIRLNFTGGEDINLTQLVTDMGGVIRYNPGAVAYEYFSEDRRSIRYIIQRTYRNSNTGLYARSFGQKDHYKLKILPRLLLRFGYGLLIAVPLFVIGGRSKLKGIIKVVNAIGGFHFLLGRKNSFYKTISRG